MDHTFTINLPEPAWIHLLIAYGIYHILYCMAYHVKIVRKANRAAKRHERPINYGYLATCIFIIWIFYPCSFLSNQTVGRVLRLVMFGELKPLCNSPTIDDM